MKPLFEIDSSYHGRGQVNFAWQIDGSYLATNGINGLVVIFDRHGQQIDEVALPTKSSCIDMKWDKDGEILAVLQDGSGAVPLYDLNSRKLRNLETGLKKLTFIQWSKTGSQLAIGTGNGTLLIYDKDSKRKETIAGKHSLAIRAGAWSQENTLALASDDKTITISTSDGTTQQQLELKKPAVELKFVPASTQRFMAGSTSAWTLSANVNHQYIWLYNENNIDDAPVELVFQKKYGKIISYTWFEQGNLLVGFSSGFVVLVSTKKDAVGKELFSSQLHKEGLHDMVACAFMEKAATCGGKHITIIDTKTLKRVQDESISIDTNMGDIDKLCWTEEGQILTVSTVHGHVHNYLAKMPSVHSSYGTQLGYLSSLREISIINILDFQRGRRNPPKRFPLETEPSIVSLGENNFAVGVNNKIFFYKTRRKTDNGNMEAKEDEEQSRDSEEQPAVVNVQEYAASVDEVVLNDKFCAVRCSSKVYLHTIEQNTPKADARLHDQDFEVKMFPESGEYTVSCIALTTNFLIYGTAEGSIEIYSLHDKKHISGAELRTSVGIKSIFPNVTGTRIIYLDDSGMGYLYNPAEKIQPPIEIPDLSPDTTKILWDGLDPFVFVTCDPRKRELCTFVYAPLTINGPMISKIGPLIVEGNGDMIMEPLCTQLAEGYQPIASFGGIVTCQQSSSQIGTIILGSHDALHSNVQNDEILKEKFSQSLALQKLEEAWNIALILDDSPFWLSLSGKAMEVMNIELAIQVWRHLGDAGMVLALERIKWVEDKHLLAGDVASLFGEYAQAQEMYLLSPNPETALSLRRDLLHWEQALKLAETVSPENIAEISAEYAQQLEFKGEYQLALNMYEKALEGLNEEDEGARENTSSEEKMSNAIATKKYKKTNTSIAYLGSVVDFPTGSADIDKNETKRKIEQCKAGIARMTLRVGNIPRGVNLALESDDKQLCKECGDILVSVKQFADAATVYEKADEFEQAAAIYIKTKNFMKVAPLMNKISTPKLHLQYAKAKEAEKDFKAAALAYTTAKDTENVVRLYLEKLGCPEKAFSLVRKTQSAVAAEMAARYCQSVSDFRRAIEFLLMAKQPNEAFELATLHDVQHKTMQVFEAALGADGSPVEYTNIAKYYESKQAWGKAGEFYAISGQYHKALKLYLQCGEDELDKAIDVVGRARSDVLTHTLIDFLMGEVDGVPKDPPYIFRLYMALGNFKQAARTAIIIAQQERDNGNYKAAHKVLFETHRELTARRIRVPQSLQMSMLLLHSYLLVKKRSKVEDHNGAARLLIRVVRNISNFPSHTVPILTSAVLFCKRGKLRASAYKYATMLMQPEYRSQVNAKFKRTVEEIVRKRGKTMDDLPDERTPTPYAPTDPNAMVEQYQLVCPVTQNHIPFCVVTGRHMLLDDWCFCPNSDMPALYSEYLKYLTALPEEERLDPVWGRLVNPEQLMKASKKDIESYLENYSSISDESQESVKQI